MSSSPSAERHNKLIAKYCVPDMGDYSDAGSYLSSILDRLDTNHALSSEDKQYIRDKGLFDLSEFVKRLEETGKTDFRILRTKFEQQHKAIVRRELWEKYEINHIKSAHMRQMIDILLRIEQGTRIKETDVLWLSTNEYFSPALKREFHNNEAVFYHNSFEKNNNPWDAVNSSSHYRKANLSQQAINLLEKIDIDSQQDKHLKSALYTTRGGAKRDLGQFDEALHLADKAHLSDPGSFHPCTLLGALYYEKGNYTLGDEWFAKAITRGATPEGVDHELRSIFMRASKAQKDALKRHLINIDPVRFSWVSQIKGVRKSDSKVTHSKSINRMR